MKVVPVSKPSWRPGPPFPHGDPADASAKALQSLVFASLQSLIP